MQTVGEQLLSEVTKSIMDVCTGTQIQEIHSKLSVIVSGYDIRRIESDEKHPDLQEKINLFIAGKQLALQREIKNTRQTKN